MFSRFYRLGSDLLYRPRLVLPDRLAVARAEDEGDDPPHDGLYLGVVRGQRDEGLVRGRLWVEAVGDEGAPVEEVSHRRAVWQVARLVPLPHLRPDPYDLLGDVHRYLDALRDHLDLALGDLCPDAQVVEIDPDAHSPPKGGVEGLGPRELR